MNERRKGRSITQKKKREAQGAHVTKMRNPNGNSCGDEGGQPSGPPR
ncbi:MAG: hypothetical protein M1387_06820 [Thaumarchaeota archaeon]|nr:hypothetical protein [Nitrososphaerota archaeon]